MTNIEPSGSTPLSSEVAGHSYRLAQANRLIRFLKASGVHYDDYHSGRVSVDLAPICGADGKIQPGPADYVAVDRGSA